MTETTDDLPSMSGRGAAGWMALSMLAEKMADRIAEEDSRKVRQNLFIGLRDACELVLGDIPELLAEFSADSVAEGLLHD